MSTENQFALMGGAGFGFSNFDPSSIQEEDVILCGIAMDVSPSIISFENELNAAFKDFIQEMQKSHVANKLMVRLSEFNEDVVVKTGFQPVSAIDSSTFNFKGKGHSTALIDAAKDVLEATMTYREQLEKTGINVKVLIFVITDGQDNDSKASFNDVKSQIDDIMKEERNITSIETIMFGVGDPSYFTDSHKQLGFKHLAVVGNTAKEIRKMVGFISASVSRSSANQPVTF